MAISGVCIPKCLDYFGPSSVNVGPDIDILTKLHRNYTGIHRKNNVQPYKNIDHTKLSDILQWQVL